MTQENEIVWLPEEQVFAFLIKRGAFVSTVQFTRGGIEYEVMVENDEYEYINEGGDGDESED